MISPCQRWLSASLLTIGLCLSFLGAYIYFAPPAGPSLEATETDIEVSHCAPGRKREFVLRLDNRSRQPIRVIGLDSC